jgi:hypothetical protein
MPGPLVIYWPEAEPVTDNYLCVPVGQREREREHVSGQPG